MTSWAKITTKYGVTLNKFDTDFFIQIYSRKGYIKDYEDNISKWKLALKNNERSSTYQKIHKLLELMIRMNPPESVG
jgi:hypothetical protein